MAENSVISPQLGVLREDRGSGYTVSISARCHICYLWYIPHSTANVVPFCLTVTHAEWTKTLKNDCKWSVQTYPGRKQTSWCRCRWLPWSAGRRDAPGPPGWWATEPAYSWSHDWCGPVGLWMLLWLICERPWSLRSEVERKLRRTKIFKARVVNYCHTFISKTLPEISLLHGASMEGKKKVIGLKWSSLFFTIQPGVSSPRAEADFEYQGFLWKLLIWEAAVSAAEMRALSRLCLCDQYLSGPIHREPGVFIAARVSAWASHTKERLGWASAAPFIAL